MIPGSNLLAAASRVIRFQPLPYRTAAGRTVNALRQYVSAWNPATEIRASVQMVSRRHYTQLGLDFQQNYIKVFASVDLLDLKRNSTGDQFLWGGRTYQIESNNTWFLQDGWASCIAIDVGDAAAFELGTAP